MRSEVVSVSGSRSKTVAGMPVTVHPQVGRDYGVVEFPAEAPESPKTLPALKEDFLSALAGLAEGALNLRQTVRVLVARGIKRKRLLQWAAEAGYTQGYVRTLLNEILRELTGVRQRKPGAGPKTPPQALALLAHARGLHGPLATKFLLAAYRASKAQDGAPKPGAAAPGTVALPAETKPIPNNPITLN